VLKIILTFEITIRNIYIRYVYENNDCGGSIHDFLEALYMNDIQVSSPYSVFLTDVEGRKLDDQDRSITFIFSIKEIDHRIYDIRDIAITYLELQKS